MFITLRSSGRGQEPPGSMEQVARRNAGPTANNGQMRTLRRPACIACQRKKLRCTGGAQHCDRCKERSINCVFPTTTAPARPSRGSTRTSSSPSAIDKSRTLQSPTDAPADPVGDDGSSSGTETTFGLPQGTVPTSNDTDVLDEDFFQFVEGLDVDLDMTEFSQNNFELDANANDALLAQTSPSSSGTYHSANNQLLGPQNTLATFLSGPESLVTAQSHTSTSEAVPPSDVQGNPTLEAPQLPAFLLPVNQNSNTGKSSSACQCLNSLLRVVQQFDDDEFRLTSLPLDQVIQLEKWLTFQCYNPLDCPNCVEISSVHSVVLILCDRLTELFECTYKRIERAGNVISSHGGGLNGLPPLPISDNADGEPTSGQLFCGTTKGAAILASCNPMMFSDEFRTQYSDEEQMHMIRVLIRLQIRNYRQLLVRLEQTNHSQNNHARQWKVKSMIERLTKTSTDVERGLQHILGLLESGQTG